jgi:hypothetical protein
MAGQGVTYTPKVGDLLLGPDGATCLVGDVNVEGGGCDDCYDAPWSIAHFPIDENGKRVELADKDKRYLWGSEITLVDGWTLSRNVLQ